MPNNTEDTIQTEAQWKDWKPTQNLVDAINKSLDAGLVRGLGVQQEGAMCIEALVCAKMGLPHSDNPPCVGAAIRAPKIALNDCDWSSNKARAEGMRKLAIAQLGSISLNQQEFFDKLKLNSTKRILPSIIQKHYDKTKDAKLLGYKLKFESLTEMDNGELWKEVYHYYRNYYYYYHYHHYYHYYHRHHHYHHYYDYYYSYGDEFLLLIADVILQTLKEMNCEGCKWLPKE